MENSRHGGVNFLCKVSRPATTLSKMTLKIMTRSVKGLFVTLNIATLCIKCHNAKCQILLIVWMSLWWVSQLWMLFCRVLWHQKNCWFYFWGERYIYVGILCFESEVFNFLFSNFSFKRLVPSYFIVVSLYDNEITSLINIYFLRISLTPSEPF